MIVNGSEFDHDYLLSSRPTFIGTGDFKATIYLFPNSSVDSSALSSNSYSIENADPGFDFIFNYTFSFLLLAMEEPILHGYSLRRTWYTCNYRYRPV